MARGLVGSETTFVMKNKENGFTYTVSLYAMQHYAMQCQYYSTLR